jgi:hypothetical protein
MHTNFYSKPSEIDCSKMKLLLFQGVAECVSLLKILQNHFYCCFYLNITVQVIFVDNWRALGPRRSEP